MQDQEHLQEEIKSEIINERKFETLPEQKISKTISEVGNRQNTYSGSKSQKNLKNKDEKKNSKKDKDCIIF